MIEEHLFWCDICTRRHRTSAEYIDVMRAALRRSQTLLPRDW
jgi:hypothetical protein